MTDVRGWLDRNAAQLPGFDERVVHLPIRHHSPACSYHVLHVLDALRPAHILIEGPRDAQALMPFLQHAETNPPIALYATYTKQLEENVREHHACYYPLCEYSPEWVALRRGQELGADVRFIDLTFPEMVEAGRDAASGQPVNLQEEAWSRHNAFLRAACRRAGTRDADDLWDHLFEANHREVSSEAFFRDVLAYCHCVRESEAHVDAETAAREACMAHHIANTRGKTVVLTGGYHAVALPRTEPGLPKVRQTRPWDREGIHLMRYHFLPLDRLNGYSAGMPSPGFYQRSWSGEDESLILLELARTLRRLGDGPPASEVILARAQLERLRKLRGHRRATREDVLDAIRSTFVKGSLDIEGVRVMAVARKLFAGDRMGSIPQEAGRPPIVLDFEDQCDRLKLPRDGGEERGVTLDLYRSAKHREASRFLHQLECLGVPFADRTRGPDFYAQQDLDRIQEVWRVCWMAATEGVLIEASAFGATVREAAVTRLERQLSDVERGTQRAMEAARTVARAASCGLHDRLEAFALRTRSLVALDRHFDSVVAAASILGMLELACEPLELHHVDAVARLRITTVERALALIDGIASTPEPEERAVVSALLMLHEQLAAANDDAWRECFGESLRTLGCAQEGSPVIAGACAGLSYGEGWVDADALVRGFTGRLGLREDGAVCAARFLQGLLATARSVCWQEERIPRALDELFGRLAEDEFLSVLPHLRLAFSDLTPRECDLMARSIASLNGASRPRRTKRALTEADAIRAYQVDRQVRAHLREFRLEEVPDDVRI